MSLAPADWRFSDAVRALPDLPAKPVTKPLQIPGKYRLISA